MTDLGLVSTAELLNELACRPVIGAVLLAEDRDGRGEWEGRQYVVTPVNVPAALAPALLESVSCGLIEEADRATWGQPGHEE
jgi:hypothetical protein